MENSVFTTGKSARTLSAASKSGGAGSNMLAYRLYNGVMSLRSMIVNGRPVEQYMIFLNSLTSAQFKRYLVAVSNTVKYLSTAIATILSNKNIDNGRVHYLAVEAGGQKQVLSAINQRVLGEGLKVMTEMMRMQDVLTRYNRRIKRLSGVDLKKLYFEPEFTNVLGAAIGELNVKSQEVLGAQIVEPNLVAIVERGLQQNLFTKGSFSKLMATLASRGKIVKNAEILDRVLGGTRHYQNGDMTHTRQVVKDSRVAFVTKLANELFGFSIPKPKEGEDQGAQKPLKASVVYRVTNGLTQFRKVVTFFNVILNEVYSGFSIMAPEFYPALNLDRSRSVPNEFYASISRQLVNLTARPRPSDSKSIIKPVAIDYVTGNQTKISTLILYSMKVKLSVLVNMYLELRNRYGSLQSSIAQRSSNLEARVSLETNLKKLTTAISKMVGKIRKSLPGYESSVAVLDGVLQVTGGQFMDNIDGIIDQVLYTVSNGDTSTLASMFQRKFGVDQDGNTVQITKIPSDQSNDQFTQEVAAYNYDIRINPQGAVPIKTGGNGVAITNDLYLSYLYFVKPFAKKTYDVNISDVKRSKAKEAKSNYQNTYGGFTYQN